MGRQTGRKWRTRDDLRDLLERAYRRFHRRELLVGDPWEYPARFKAPQDIECAAFIAAALSYGSKKVIAATLEKIAQVLGPNPAEYAMTLAENKTPRASELLPQHRWTKPSDLTRLLKSIGRLYRNDRGITCFFAGRSLEGGMNEMAEYLRKEGVPASLVPAPKDGSACKRPLMFLRWVVRNDGLDFGIWKGVVSPRDLVIPLDVHTYRAARALGLTQRKPLNWKTALEVTHALRLIDPDDPVRFDFALHYISFTGAGEFI